MEERKMEENKQGNKREEIISKAADAVSEGAKKLDKLVDGRSALGDLSAPITLGVILMLVVAVANNAAGMLVVGLIGVALGLAPKILKAIMAKKSQMDAKKVVKSEDHQQLPPKM
jgi:F0F1-type ATP synthase assembly protein I